MSKIIPVVMPKWGLTMEEGVIDAWLVNEGDQISVGTPIAEIGTDKISNVYEAPDAGLFRLKVAQVGETLPVQALIGVIAPADVSDAEIAEFVRTYVPEVAE
ncbi:hypothetical protein CKF54_05075 [Psittacicella hinzii]|uniref:Lipoyl-binding domain-containing protein n=1 Tax=Psittacicella hinzii TaxID=2028575 RepID=A0A3A1Y294_9GAMM|nr:biotin/lipoyl-containing protein [Psittacicella hinzii]RIY32353.1 hypothetical protein CKF54_05075 [Psittacicella hinzii]